MLKLLEMFAFLTYTSTMNKMFFDSDWQRKIALERERKKREWRAAGEQEKRERGMKTRHSPVSASEEPKTGERRAGCDCA